MKTSILACMAISSLFLSSCVKLEEKTTSVEIPEIKSVQPLTLKKSGYKCDLVGEAGSKEIFINLDENDGKITARFHDFTSTSKIKLVSATYDDYTILSFPLWKSDDNKKMEGHTTLLHSDKSRLSEEGEVISVTGVLTLNEEMSGKLERKLLISKEDSSIEETPLQEIGKFENCEKFEASAI